MWSKNFCVSETDIFSIRPPLVYCWGNNLGTKYFLVGGVLATINRSTVSFYYFIDSIFNFGVFYAPLFYPAGVFAYFDFV